MFVEIIIMDSKDEFKKIDIENCTCYYFDDITTDWDICSDNSLLDEKSTGAIPLHIRFNEIDGFIKTYDRVKCWVLFHYGWFNKICDRIKYLISKKSGIKDSINHNLEESELIYIIICL